MCWCAERRSRKGVMIHSVCVWTDVCGHCFLQPIGALNPTRLHKYEERYSSFEDEAMPPFFYGTHYSTMGAVLHWMVRVVSVIPIVAMGRHWQ